jgi:hypothetical protein
MSQTDTKPGFRLPWTATNADAQAPTDGAAGESSAVDAEASMTAESQTTVEATDQAGTGEPQTSTEEQVTPDMIDTTAGTSARRPTKFMADLSRAMQTAAETSRDETMTRFATDAKTAVEDIRAKSAEEAAALRRQADDDVAAVREWSKTEIARIREETDTKIAARKQALDGEMDDFAAVIEARVQKVNATVADYETEMAEFFERLLAEQDPTRIATMAQAMPDPPDLSSIATFKRSLGRVAGVSAIGVASGPDGEFVFTVSHENGLNLGEAITGLPGFDARIGAETPDGLEVSAHDPDGD